MSQPSQVAGGFPPVPGHPLEVKKTVPLAPTSLGQIYGACESSKRIGCTYSVVQSEPTGSELLVFPCWQPFLVEVPKG